MGLLDDTSDNWLVAPASNFDQNYPTAGFVRSTNDAGWAGGTAWEGVVSARDGIKSGDWVSAGLGLVSVGIDEASLMFDPIGTVAGQIVGWMLEHSQPCRFVLHALSGNADMVKGYAQTWENIGKEMESLGEGFRQSVQQGTTRWYGDTADRYRDRALEAADLALTISAAADGLRTATLMMAEVVNGVRTIVRDLLSNLAGELVSATVELLCTSGLALPLVVEQTLWRIAGTGAKIVKVMGPLVKTIGRLGKYLTAIKDALEALWKWFQASRTGRS